MKRSLPSRLLLPVVLALTVLQSRAQNEVLDDINGQLRSYFSPLSRPATNLSFLYDMAAHQTDSIYFQTACPQVNVTDAWYKVYEEMYHAAYDTTQLVNPDEVFYRGNHFYADTIPIGILYFSHYVLKPDAMTTNTYFDFDTINDVLSDKPGRASWPYLNSGIFMAAPMIAEARHRNPVFRIDPQFMFYDGDNAGAFAKDETIQIDFGDGNGFIPFDPTQVTHYQVTYSGSGEHEIIVARGTAPNPSIYSRSVIGTTITLAPPPPDRTFSYPGINVGFYGACNATPNSSKVIIYLSGIDNFDAFDWVPGINSLAKTTRDIYEEKILPERLVQLKNFGYNFLVVDWERSNIDIRFNALYLVNMLHQLKCDLALNDNQQFVVIGESLGGIIGRYALTYMETQDYRNGVGTPFFVDQFDPNNLFYLQTHAGIFLLPQTWAGGGCQPDKMHNTRLFMTFDSPHQGANIPLSVQLLYKGAGNQISRYIGGTYKQLATLNNLFLDGQASQQLLLYHYDTRSGIGPDKNYTSLPEKAKFFKQLRDMGNYPRYAKVMVMSDGALNGEGQVNVNTGTPRTPNDRLLDFGTELYAKSAVDKSAGL